MRWACALRLAAPLGAAMLCACVVVPVPISEGYRPETRANLPAQQPQTIAAGRSTRTDVLLALGTPDLQAPDESWFVYFSAFHKGGVSFEVVLLGGGALPLGALGHVSAYQNRSLVLRFDAAGVVDCVAFEQIELTKGMTTRELKPEQYAQVTYCVTAAQITSALRASPQSERPAADEPPPPFEFKGQWFVYSSPNCSSRSSLGYADGIVRLTPTGLSLAALSPDGLSIQVPYKDITALRSGLTPLLSAPPPLEVELAGERCLWVRVLGDSLEERTAARARMDAMVESNTGLKVQGARRP